MKKKIITFITDFGTKDGYVGAMKGVCLSINPNVLLIDISHDIPPQDIVSAAFCLETAYSYYPDNSIHVVVVDPGVGSFRKPIIIEMNNQFFVGPDNGVFSLLFKKMLYKSYHISNQDYFLSNVSNTFHGRDIFSPIASHISLGVLPKNFGKETDNLLDLDIPEIKIKDNSIIGKIITVDRFGSLITNIRKKDLELLKSERVKVFINNKDLGEIKLIYSDVLKGMPLALFGSKDYLEISVNQGSALDYFGNYYIKHSIIIKKISN